MLWQQDQITRPAADNTHGPSSFSLQLEADLKISNYSKISGMQTLVAKAHSIKPTPRKFQKEVS